MCERRRLTPSVEKSKVMVVEGEGVAPHVKVLTYEKTMKVVSLFD